MDLGIQWFDSASPWIAEALADDLLRVPDPVLFGCCSLFLELFPTVSYFLKKFDFCMWTIMHCCVCFVRDFLEKIVAYSSDSL